MLFFSATIPSRFMRSFPPRVTALLGKPIKRLALGRKTRYRPR
jgi:hypothetical protein